MNLADTRLTQRAFARLESIAATHMGAKIWLDNAQRNMKRETAWPSIEIKAALLEGFADGLTDKVPLADLAQHTPTYIMAIVWGAHLAKEQPDSIPADFVEVTCAAGAARTRSIFARASA